ncbi:MAG: hypothetical protein R2690_21135 [Acidimicrobiales bacterium]
MHAFALNCTLKPSPEASSTDHLLDRLAALLTETDERPDAARRPGGAGGGRRQRGRRPPSAPSCSRASTTWASPSPPTA